jgi:hypothetical protein
MRLHHINHPDNDWLQIVRRHIEPLHYGSVSIIVQDSRVIQIEKTERRRLQKDSPAQNGEVSRPSRGVRS